MSDSAREEYTPSRRGVLAGAGAAVAGGVVAAMATSSTGAQADTGSGVAVNRSGETAVEFRGRISQTGNSGEQFTSYGFLTRVQGAAPSDLFAGTATSVGTALFTVYATGELTARVLDQSVHALDIVGNLTVYQRATPGADFADPSSFTVGRAVAAFDLSMQDVLTVFAPSKGIPTLTGDMHQTAADRLSGGLSGRKFGSRGQRLRMFATGLGMLVDPVTLNANLEIAGNWTAD
jgi:hypothetical protein